VTGPFDIGNYNSYHMGQSNQYQKFQIVTGGFEFKGLFHPFSMITHLFYSAVGVHVNFAKNPSYHGATLRIYLNNGHSITLHFHDEVTWYRNRATDLSNLWEAYLYLSQETFSQRMNSYLTQLSTKGYFEYDECRFYPPDKVVFRGQTFMKEDCQFLKSANWVELMPKNCNFWGKAQRFFSSKTPQFNTQTDRDVIFAILDERFGLRWKQD
jgi:hypothetical protein